MEDTVLKQIRPHDSDAEKSVICCMLADKRSIDLAGELLVKGDFYEKQYGIIFESMVEMNNAARPVDVITLQNHLREKDVPEEVASMEFIRELMDLPISSVYVKDYAKIVKEKSLLRRLILASDEISSECYDPKNPINDIFDRAEKRIFEIVQKKNTDEFTPINKIVESAIVRIEKVMESGSRITGIPTGFQDLDLMLSGLQPSDLILIAARPSMGKTAFALNIAHHVGVRKKETVVIFSLEMSKEQLVNRLLSMDSKVDAQKIRNASFEDTEIVNLLESASNIGSSKLIIDDTSSISVSELRTKCRKYKLEHDLKLIVIDYLQMMTGSGRSESKQQEISEISRSLKAVAREIGVPVVALSQLSRAVEKREDHRPMLSDLRESGAIEQDADVVMFLYRDDYYNKDQDNKKKNITEIIVAKQRNGPIGSVELAWIPKWTTFANLDSGSKY